MSGYVGHHGGVIRNNWLSISEGLEYFDTGIMAPADLVAGGHSLAVPFIENQIDRFSLAMDVIDRVPRLRSAGSDCPPLA